MAKSLLARISQRHAATHLALIALGGAIVGCASENSAPEPSCAVSSVRVTPQTTPLIVGATTTFSAAVTAQHCSSAQLAVEWASNLPGVAWVNGAGVVTALTPGRATIRANIGAVAGAGEVVVQSQVARVDVTPNTATLVQGDTLQLTATLRDTQGGLIIGRAISWQSLSTPNATVSAAGLVKALSPAPSIAIVATSEGVSGTATLAVVPPPRLVLDSARIGFSIVSGAALPAPATITIRNGGGGTLGGLSVAPVQYDTPASGWLQASLSTASATPTATLTLRVISSALAAGRHMATVRVNALAEGAPQEIAVTIDVTAPLVGSVSVTPATLLVAVGGKQQMTATVRDANGGVLTGTSVRWSSSNPAVAAVDSTTGLLTAAAVGVTTVRASVGGVIGSAFAYTGTVSAYDGSWRGQAGSGRTFAMTILLGRITSLTIGVGTPPGAPCALTYTASPLTLVSNNSFGFSTSGTTSNAAIAGAFLSSSSAQGTYGTVTFDDYVCPPNLLVSGNVTGGSWTAAKQ